jgi:hypothetical protein
MRDGDAVQAGIRPDVLPIEVRGSIQTCRVAIATAALA